MKPRTKIQIKVDELSRQLHRLNIQEVRWAKRNSLCSYFYPKKNTNTCLDCKHTWKEKVKREIEHCPKCKTKTVVPETSFESSASDAEESLLNEFQVYDDDFDEPSPHTTSRAVRRRTKDLWA